VGITKTSLQHTIIILPFVLASMLATLSARLVSFRGVDASELLALKSLPIISSADVQSAVGAFKLLLSFPPEYVGRVARTEFMKRALALDVFISRNTNAKHATASTWESKATLRTFLGRIAAAMGPLDVLVRCLACLSMVLALRSFLPGLLPRVSTLLLKSEIF
jgi:hypothetical protein